MTSKTLQKGFTLIELLVVIAIVAILATVVILTLNPAELLRQARDSNRASDLSTLNSALSLYLADVSTINLGSGANCYYSYTVSPGPNCGFSGSGVAGNYTAVGTTSRAISGTGWLPVVFTDISSGAPLGQLPIDPTNTGQLVYRYVASSTTSTFKLGAKMESSRYSFNGADDKEQFDGGTSTTLFEIGTSLGL